MFCQCELGHGNSHYDDKGFSNMVCEFRLNKFVNDVFANQKEKLLSNQENRWTLNLGLLFTMKMVKYPTWNY